MPQTSSARRVAASRANGSLFRGPKTARGKLRSTANNRKHGLADSHIRVLPAESEPEFLALKNRLQAQHLPANR